MDCKHRTEFPQDDYKSKTLRGRCKICGRFISGKAYAYFYDMDEAKLRKGKYDYDTESKAQEQAMSYSL